MWLEPFVKSVAHLVPLHRINRIRGYSVPIDKGELQDAAITLPDKKRKYNINIRIKNNDYIKGKQRNAYTAQILSHLSHELAHIKHWDHSPKHLMLEAKILLKFARVAGTMGIRDLWVRHKPAKDIE
jgi:hypothetical protein